MSCIWNLFRKKKAPPEVKLVNPLLLDTLPMNLDELKTYETTLQDAIHLLNRQIEKSKLQVALSLENGQTNRMRDLLAKRSLYVEKRKLLENRLSIVQEKLKENS